MVRDSPQLYSVIFSSLGPFGSVEQARALGPADPLLTSRPSPFRNWRFWVAIRNIFPADHTQTIFLLVALLAITVLRPPGVITNRQI